MKLYATTTSERATKGQGGNEFISAELTIGETHPRIVLLAQIIKGEGGNGYLLHYRIAGDNRVHEVVLDEKGEKQKTNTNSGMYFPHEW